MYGTAIRLLKQVRLFLCDTATAWQASDRPKIATRNEHSQRGSAESRRRAGMRRTAPLFPTAGGNSITQYSSSASCLPPVVILYMYP